MKIEEIISDNPFLDKKCSSLKSSNELLAFLIVNQDKILSKGWKIALIEESYLVEPENQILDLNNNIVLLKEEYQNLKNLIFNNKFETLLKEE